MRIFICFCALAVLATSAFALDIKGFKPTRTVVYKDIGGAKLELNIFEPEGHKATDKRPAIVFFFGGGWNGGSPSQFYPHCDYLAKRGMVAMSANYRVKSRNKTTPFECVKDGKSAMRYIRSHAKELGVDPGRVAAGGGSAGGHVAATTGVVPGLEEKGEDTKISSRADALLLVGGVFGRARGFEQAVHGGPAPVGERVRGKADYALDQLNQATAAADTTKGWRTTQRKVGR